MKRLTRLCCLLVVSLLIVFSAVGARAQIVIASSSFNSDAEGWVVRDLPSPNPGAPPAVQGTHTPTFNASGGNPSGGHISLQDPSLNAWYWFAPPTYLGDMSAAYGGTLRYDLAVTGSGTGFSQPDVILVGGGMTLVRSTGFNPPPSSTVTWNSIAVGLTEAGWLNGSSGLAATQAEMLTVLGCLSAVYIRGEYLLLLDDVGRLDNVSISAPTTQVTAGALIISEFRLRGPNGANDEFIELYNNTRGFIIVIATDSSAGYAIASEGGVIHCAIPNGTVIPARHHYLCVNAVGYSLGGYAAGTGTTAVGDATYTTDISDNTGLALFSTTNAPNFSLATRLDAVGFTTSTPLYRELTGLPPLAPFSINYAFVRDECGKAGSITTFGACPSGGNVVDANNNATDFFFVDTNGTSAGAGQRLGAPGPQNLSSPVQRNACFDAALLSSCASPSAPPNRFRDFTSNPGNCSTLGTLEIRRTITNNSIPLATRLRFRVIDITTFPAPSGIADLRPISSSSLAIFVGCGTTGTVMVQGTTLEQPPAQPNCGGFNSSLSLIPLEPPLPLGGSVNVRFLLGVQQSGSFKFFVNVEALP
jgi:hypothetical protein